MINDLVSGLFSGHVAVEIPDNRNDIEAFLTWLKKACPFATWNDGSELTEFFPNPSLDKVRCFHAHHLRGLMYDSRVYIQETWPHITFATTDEVMNFNHHKPDFSAFVDDLL